MTTLPTLRVDSNSLDSVRNVTGRARVTNTCLLVIINTDSDKLWPAGSNQLDDLRPIIRGEVFMAVAVGRRMEMTAASRSTWTTLVNIYHENRKPMVDLYCPGAVHVKRRFIVTGQGSFLSRPGSNGYYCNNLLDGRQLNIGYNLYGFEFQITKEGGIDPETCEGAVLDLFVRQNSLDTRMYDSNFDWGGYDEATQTWTGIVNSVRV